MTDLTDSSAAGGLTGKMLIAMPGMTDPRFERSVVYLCAHSPEGAMGLIVNKPNDEVQITDLLSQLEIESGPMAPQRPVHFGGPVETGRGFVLHSRDYVSDISTLEVENGLGMTATLDILEDIARGEGPVQSLLALGYAGWGPGQLEAEIQANGWLTCDGAPELIFGRRDEAKWDAALKSLGIDPLALSSAAGHA